MHKEFISDFTLTYTNILIKITHILIELYDDCFPQRRVCILLRLEKSWPQPNENQAMGYMTRLHEIFLWWYEGERAPERRIICPSWYNSQNVQNLLKVRFKRMNLNVLTYYWIPPLQYGINSMY